jgi:hypothetical protein
MSAEQDLLNLVRREAERAVEARIKPPRHGIVSSYDPSTFTVKVTFPEDLDTSGKPKITGWLPLSTQSAGNGWGICFAPALGAQVGVHFAEDDPDSGFVSHHIFSGPDQPLGTPEGELWMQHQTGTCIKMTGAGEILAGMADGTFQRLATERFVLDIFNAHSHGYLPGTGTLTQTTAPNLTVPGTGDTTHLTAQLKAT